MNLSSVEQVDREYSVLDAQIAHEWLDEIAYQERAAGDRARKRAQAEGRRQRSR